MVTMVSRVVEDYLEVIYNIAEEGGRAKTNDISKRLNVKPASVTEMLQGLDKKGLVLYKKYAGVTLTKKGEKIARSVKKRHTTIAKLLQVIQVPKSTAEKDACVMEHSLSPRTIEQLIKFVNFVENCPVKVPDWRKCFKIYCKTGKYSKCHKK